MDYLRSKESQISWSALIPGAFFDWGMKLGLFGFDLRSKTATLVDGGTAIFTASTLPTIARGILAMLEYSHATKNQYVYISSFHTCQMDILAVLERIDVTKWTVKHVTSEEVVSQGNQRLSEGDKTNPKHLVGTLLVIQDHAVYGTRSWESRGVI